MRPLNDDMEDLIRRAAQDYPLDVSGADWKKVQGAMHATEKGRKRWLLLLLLLPLAGIGYVLLDGKNGSKNTPQQAHREMVSNEKPLINDNTSSAIEMEKRQPPLREKAIYSVHDNLSSNKSAAIVPINRAAAQQGGKGLTTNEVTGRSVSTLTDYFADNTSAIEVKDRYEAFPPLINATKTEFRIRAPLSELTVGNYNFMVRSKEHASRKNSFYVGLFGGLDATSIKSQGFDRAGHFYGLLAGYYISERLSVETGIYSTKKYYFTSGQYFDKSKIAAPASWRISDVEGNCRMLEIPLTVRYDFARSNSVSWFGAAGVRSYLMQKEYYDYNAVYSNGTSGYHDYTYTKGSQHVAAELSFSAGVQKSLGKWADLRVEPFVQLPLSKVGIGSLPFTNVGVQFGLSKKLD